MTAGLGTGDRGGAVVVLSSQATSTPRWTAKSSAGNRTFWTLATPSTPTRSLAARNSVPSNAFNGCSAKPGSRLMKHNRSSPPLSVRASGPANSWWHSALNTTPCRTSGTPVDTTSTQPAQWGAALALTAVAEQLDITVKVLGTPAEETTGGKVDLIEAGFFDDVSLAMMVHAGAADVVGGSSLAMSMWDVLFEGRPAHAAAAPSEGVNALDALVIAQMAIALARQQLPPDRSCR